jgi:hypothetical protein
MTWGIKIINFNFKKIFIKAYKEGMIDKTEMYEAVVILA